jgi:hypothetical protein
MNAQDIITIKGWINSCQGPIQFDLIRAHVDLMFDTGKVSKEQFAELIVCLKEKLDSLQVELNRIRFGMMPHQVVNVLEIEPKVSVHNIFTNPGPDAPMADLANTLP